MKKIGLIIFAFFITLSLGTTVVAGRFTDVKASDWFYSDVESAVELGLINGKANNTYCPNDNLTYAEAVKLAACMHQKYSKGKVTLENGNPWYKTYFDYCVDKKIITDDYESFPFNEKATRAGYMIIFANALPKKALSAQNTVPDNSIPDVEMSAEYAEAVYKLYRAGIVAGSDAEHNCKPDSNIKRSEVAAILSRMMDEGKRVSFEMSAPKLIVTITLDRKNIKANETSVAKVTAQGGSGAYTYKWQQYKNDAWRNVRVSDDELVGAQTDTLTLTPSKTGDIELRCVVTDKAKTSVESDSVMISVATNLAVELPETLELPYKGSVDILAVASGGKKPYTYSWKVKYYGSSDFVDASNTGDRMTLKVDNDESVKYQNGMKLLCTITDANQNSVTSNETSISVKGFEESKFLMYVDDVVTITGRGTVVTGRVVNGALKKGDEIQIMHFDGTVSRVKVEGIEMFRKMLDEAKANDSIGVLLGNAVSKDDISRGEALVGLDTPYVHTSHVVGTLEVLSAEKGGRTITEGSVMNLLFGTRDSNATLWNLGTLQAGKSEKNVLADFQSVDGVWYVGQKISVRASGNTLATFTVTRALTDEEYEKYPKNKLCITKSPSSVVVGAKDTLKFSCVASGGQGEYTYQWQYTYGDIGTFIDISPADRWAYNCHAFELQVFVDKKRNLDSTYRFRCVVMDETGQTVVSDVASVVLTQK